VFTLADVYAVPLTPERAAHEFKRLSGIMVSFLQEFS
jgi:hypothetical protein